MSKIVTAFFANDSDADDFIVNNHAYYLHIETMKQEKMDKIINQKRYVNSETNHD